MHRDLPVRFPVPPEDLSMNQHPADVAQQRGALIVERLPVAAARGALSLVYQPEVDVRHDTIVAFEALLRWHDAVMGQVPPAEFIPVAESAGLIAGLGDWVLGQVLADLPQILAVYPSVRVALNVSGVELADPDFSRRVATRLQAVAPMSAQHLEFEITESVFALDLPAVVSHVEGLRSLGASVAIDDFGTGASSLARLHQIPFDKIKLDRAFVDALDQPISKAIIKAMLDLGQQFGLKTVVEGIESSGQLRELQHLGCSLAQGYLFAAPAPLAVLLSAGGWSAG